MVKLSVVIPTWNRPYWVGFQLTSLRRLFAMVDIPCEIVLSDNHSKPSCRESLPPEFYEGLPITEVKPEKFLNKAEQNMFFALSKARGEYVWVLGDDDPIVDEGFLHMCGLLKSGEFDYLVFNSNSYLLSGQFLNGSVKCSNPSEITNLEVFIKKTGFWYTIAGFSNSVFKRPTTQDLDHAHEIAKINPIYSHVFWLCEMFWNSRFSYVPVPLVTYSENDRDTVESTHWPDLAAADKVFSQFYWTLGFARQIRHLRQKLGLPAGWLRDVWTTEWNIKRFPALTHVATMFCNELLGKAPGPGIARDILPTEIQEMAQFLVEENSKYGPLFAFLARRNYDLKQIRLDGEFIDRFVGGLWNNHLFDFFVTTYRDFSIYHLHGQYIGVPTQALSRFAALFTDITVQDGVGKLVGGSFENLQLKIDGAHVDPDSWLNQRGGGAYSGTGDYGPICSELNNMKIAIASEINQTREALKRRPTVTYLINRSFVRLLRIFIPAKVWDKITPGF